jgi:serine/threonine protein kinase
MHQLIDILEFFDRHGVIYRNFKPENIVFTKKDDLSSLKIFNFEAASCEDTDILLKRHYSSNYMQENAKKILVTEKLLSNTTIDESEFGSIKYLAPEIVLKRDHSKIADIWSVGVIFYLLLTNTHPLQHLADFVGPKEMKQTIVSILQSETPELLVDFNHPNLKDLPANILTLLHKMLAIQQKNRISIKDAEAIHCMLNYD